MRTGYIHISRTPSIINRLFNICPSSSAQHAVSAGVGAGRHVNGMWPRGGLRLIHIYGSHAP